MNSMTFICDGTSIIGEVTVENDLRVEGYIKGTVKTGGVLVVGPTGKIEGEVITRSANIAGQVVGNLKGLEKIVLEAKSTLIGDLQTRDLIINEGAVFQGNCSMKANEAQIE